MLTKLVRLITCAAGGGELSAKEIARIFLDNVVRFYGIPRQVVHDCDPRFTSIFQKALFEILGSKLLYSSAYHPQTDGQIKQMNKVVKQLLCTMANDVNAKWVDKLSFVEFTINSSVNASMGKTPFELVYGQQVQNVVDQLDGLHCIKGAQQMVDNISKLVEKAKTKLLQVKESQAKYYDKHHHPVEFSVNDKVLLSTKNLQLSGTRKYQQNFNGPLTVTKRIGSQAYRLQPPLALQRFHNVFHVFLLKLYVAGGNGVKQPQTIIIDGKPEWDIETILQHWHHRSIQQYVVKYVGYDQSEFMQVDESDLVNAPDLLADYRARIG